MEHVAFVSYIIQFGFNPSADSGQIIHFSLQCSHAAFKIIETVDDKTISSISSICLSYG